MTCHERVQESLMTEAPPCLEAVLQRCPRCSHLLSSRCQEATALRELWSEEVDEAITSNPPAISHGIVYGPSETELSQKYPYKFSKILPECFVETRYIASCGHESMTCCSRGFRFSDGTLDEPPCTEKITFQSPICGHQIEAHCHLRPTSSAVFTTVCKERFSPISGKIERFVDEQELRNAPSPNSEFKNLSKICQDSVSIVRDCGHQTSGFLCSRIFASLNHNRIPPCDALIDVRRPCGHVFEVRCHRQTEPLPVCMEPVDELFNYPCGKANHSTQPRTCHELALLRLDIDIQCPVNVECIRARCGHSVNVVCYLEESVTRTSPGSVLDFNVSPVVIQEETEYCESAAGVAECMAPVIYQRACGHQNVGVPCSTAFSWSASPAEAPPCQNEIVTKSPLCSHGIRILCCRKPDVFSYDPWCQQPPDHVTVDVQDEDEVKTCPVVYAGERVPLHSPEMDVLLHCGQTTLLQRVCGHEAKIPCETIFDALKMACEEPQQVECQKCMKTRTYPCHKNSSMSMQCENLVEKKCSLCSENTVRIECYKDVVLCKREVSSLLRCGHSVKWMCGDEDPRLSEPADACLICTHKTWSDVRDNSLTLLHQKETLKNESRNENTAFLAAAAERRLRGEVNPENFNFIELVTGLRKRALDAVPESWISEFVEVNSISELRLLGAYVDILTQNIDNFARSMASEDLEGLRLCRPPRISDESSAYDIVYFVRGSKQHTADCFRYSFTRYGMGITAYLFSTESLLHFIKK